MTESVLLCDIKDNPYRDKKRNPIDKELVDQLVESIDSTEEFWEGVYGRHTEDGHVEIAFGHHRVDAARKVGLKAIPITVKQLSDGEMLMRMARENVKGELPVMLEAVSATVKALAEGKIARGTAKNQMLPVDPRTRKDSICYAPSFIPGKVTGPLDGPHHAYTAATVARFLGGMYLRSTGKAQDSVQAALAYLGLEERKVPGLNLCSLQKVEDDEVKYVSAKKIITLAADVNKREVKIAERKDKTKEEIAALDREARAIEAERKAREKAIEEKEEQLLKEMKEARKAEDEKKAQEIQDRIKAANEAAKKKDEDDVVKLLDLEVKINERKEKEVEQRKEDLYVPIRKEVDRIVHLLERRDEEEELKALSRKGINPGDRERVRQAAMKKGSWFTDVIQDMFLPPISVKKKLSEYRSREESKRRAEETTKPAKKGKK